jgi:hypothetical protein
LDFINVTPSFFNRIQLPESPSGKVDDEFIPTELNESFNVETRRFDMGTAAMHQRKLSVDALHTSVRIIGPGLVKAKTAII